VRSWPLCLAIPLAACGGSDRPVAQPAASVPARPPDSLVLTTPQGVEVWFTLARPGKAADGTPCIDRAIQIRKEGARIPVPLLYTNRAPELVNDTMLRARLSDHCRPGDAYLVDLRSGRPVRER
jgi:hypothetical protein